MATHKIACSKQWIYQDSEDEIDIETMLSFRSKLQFETIAEVNS